MRSSITHGQAGTLLTLALSLLLLRVALHASITKIFKVRSTERRHVVAAIVVAVRERVLLRATVGSRSSYLGRNDSTSSATAAAAATAFTAFARLPVAWLAAVNSGCN